MARPRKPRPGRAARAPRTPGEYRSTVGALGGGELMEAAQEIGKGAQENASWSASIPPSMLVEGDDKAVTISFDAGPAYPAETRARHPLFGNRRHWYGPPGERFLSPAADQRAGPALARYAKKIDRMCRERGFE